MDVKHCASTKSTEVFLWRGLLSEYFVFEKRLRNRDWGYYNFLDERLLRSRCFAFLLWLEYYGDRFVFQTVARQSSVRVISSLSLSHVHGMH